MKTLGVLIGLLLLGFAGIAQHNTVHVTDTVLLDMVNVREVIPLNDDVHGKHIGASNAQSMDRVCATLGGVSLVSRGAFAKEPMLHSFSAGQINVTIDGMKVFGACTDKMDPVTSYVEPVNLLGVDIKQGSNGLESGGSVGGSFDMRLRKAILNRVEVQAGGLVESVSRASSMYAGVNVGGKKWAYRLNGNRKLYHNYQDGAGDVVEYSQFGKLNLQQSLLYVSDKGHRFVADVLLDEATNVGYPALPMDVGVAKGRIASLEFAPELGSDRWTGVRMKLYGNSIYHLMDDSQRDSLFFVENSSTGKLDSVYMRMDMPGWSTTVGGMLAGELNWNARHVLQLKVDGYQNRSRADMTMYMNNRNSPGEAPMFAETWPEHKRTEVGMLVRNNFRWNDRLGVSVDLRVNASRSAMLSEFGLKQFETVGYFGNGRRNSWTKSGNIVGAYAPTNSTTVQAGVGFGERLPTLTEQFGFYLFSALDGYDYVGNPECKNEKSWNIWANWSFTSEHFKLKAEAYVHWLQDYILAKQIPNYHALNLYASGVKRYGNIDHARVIALNAQLVWMPRSDWEVYTLVKYNEGQDELGLPLPQIQPLKSISAITYRYKKLYIRPELELSAAQHRISNDFGETATDAYQLANLRIGSRFTFKKLRVEISGSIENILNVEYAEHLDWGSFNRPGRNFTCGVNLTW